MFPFEPVPQKVKSPLTSALQMKPSQLSNTKFIGSLLNKDRAGCYLKKESPIRRDGSSCAEPGIQMQQMKARRK